MLNSKREDYKKANCLGYEMKADLILAEKTLEMLRLVEMADLIVKDKFQGDSRRWMDAMFRVLMFRNSAYVWEERHQLSDDQVLCHKLHENVSRAYSELERAKQGNDLSESSSYSNFMLTGSALIKVFSRFSNLLVKEGDIPSLDFTDSVKELKNIEKNVSRCLGKYDGDSGQSRKTSETNDVKTNRCDSFTSSSSLSSTSSASVSALCTVAGTGGCANRTVTPSTSVSKESSSDLKCEDCGEKISVFNNDVDFSRSLHTQEKGHKDAVAAKWSKLQFKTNANFASLVKKAQRKTTPSESPKPSRSLSEGDKSDGSVDNVLTSDLELTIRTTLDSQLGEQSSYIHIVSNVLPHIGGKAHHKSWEKRIQELGGGDVLEKTAIPKKKEPVLQISSSAIPVKNLIFK